MDEKKMKRTLAGLFAAVSILASAHAEEAPVPQGFYDYQKGASFYKLETKERTNEYTHYSFNYPSVIQTNYPDNTVFLEFYEPRGRSKYPAVVFLGHIAGSMPQIEGELCRDFASNGITVILVQTAYQKNYSFSRNWFAEGSTGCATVDIIQLFRQIVVEGRRAIDWLETKHEVESSKIGAMGISLGGIAVPILGGVDKRVRAMAILLGGGDIGEIIWNGAATKTYKKCLMAEGIGSAEDLEDRLREIDPLTFAEKAKDRPILMINAHFDLGIPRSCTLKLWEALDKPRLIWLPAGHYISLFEIGYPKVKTFQFFYAELIDREKAKDIGLAYYPESPVYSFSINPDVLKPEKSAFDVEVDFGGGYKDAKMGAIAKNLFGSTYFGGGEAYWRAADDGRYHMDGLGGDIVYGSRLTENTHGFLKYSYETVDVRDVASWAPEDFKRHTGRTGTSILSFAWERNTLDDVLYPVDGSYYGASLGMASRAFGGNYNFIRATGEGRWYISTPLPRITFVFRGKGGWASEYGDSTDVPFFERFTLGGDDTIRGYKARSLGPRDENNLPLWGNVMLLGNIETRFQIYKWFNGVLFYDAGGNWEHLNRVRLPKDLQNSVGAGIRLRTKWTVIRFDYGYPLNSNEEGRKGRFHVNVGVPF